MKNFFLKLSCLSMFSLYCIVPRVAQAMDCGFNNLVLTTHQGNVNQVLGINERDDCCSEHFRAAFVRRFLCIGFMIAIAWIPFHLHDQQDRVVTHSPTSAPTRPPHFLFNVSGLENSSTTMITHDPSQQIKKWNQTNKKQLLARNSTMFGSGKNASKLQKFKFSQR